MEEAQSYFRDEGIETIIQLATQHERRLQSNNITISRWSQRLLRSSSSTSSFIIQFNKSNLLSSDPLFIVEENTIPLGYKILIDYELENEQDEWIYSESFDSVEWSKEFSLTSYVRKRKIQRLLVANNLYFKAEILCHNWKSKYRTIHPQFIAAALKGYKYKIEYVIEYQRFFRDKYDSYNLTYADPAHWNYAFSVPPIQNTTLSNEYETIIDETGNHENLGNYDFIDPTSCPISYLRPLDQCTSFKLIDGWEILHDFIHILHPNKDDTGWQYSSDFKNDCEISSTFSTSSSSISSYSSTMSSISSTHITTSSSTTTTTTIPNNNHNQNQNYESKWFSSSHGKDGLRPVRRRLWMRTLVNDCDLDDCRSALDSYISSHPRGIIFSSRLQRRSYYRKRWCEAVATLRDHTIEIDIENNYQKFVSYPLQGCEPVLLSQLSNSDDLINKFFLFGLRRIGGAVLPGIPVVENNLDSTKGIICIVNAPSAEIRDEWISALTHQLLLVNTFRYLRHSCPDWSPLIGPPCLVDIPYISGRLWKKGDVVWKLRTFELRKSGILAYFKRGRLLGEIKLLNECSIRISKDTSFQYPFEIISNDGSVILELAATNSVIRNKWMNALRWSISAAYERKLSISSALAAGIKKEDVNVFWYNGEIDRSDSTTTYDTSSENIKAEQFETNIQPQDSNIGTYGTDAWMLMMVGLHSERERSSSEVDCVYAQNHQQNQNTNNYHRNSGDFDLYHESSFLSNDNYSQWTGCYNFDEEIDNLNNDSSNHHQNHNEECNSDVENDRTEYGVLPTLH